MSEEIVKQWLVGAASSTGQKDLETHVGMLSRCAS